MSPSDSHICMFPHSLSMVLWLTFPTPSSGQLQSACQKPKSNVITPDPPSHGYLFSVKNVTILSHHKIQSSVPLSTANLSLSSLAQRLAIPKEEMLGASSHLPAIHCTAPFCHSINICKGMCVSQGSTPLQVPWYHGYR